MENQNISATFYVFAFFANAACPVPWATNQSDCQLAPIALGAKRKETGVTFPHFCVWRERGAYAKHTHSFFCVHIAFTFFLLLHTSTVELGNSSISFIFLIASSIHHFKHKALNAFDEVRRVSIGPSACCLALGPP